MCNRELPHLTMHLCILKENTATYCGGATYIEDSCIFERNAVKSLRENTSGGAISVGLNNNRTMSMTIKQCLFKENKTTQSHGASAISYTQSLILKNCPFERNTVKSLKEENVFAGVIQSDNTLDITVQQCLFKENTANYSSSAIHI